MSMPVLSPLPHGWRWVTLRDVAHIVGGITKGQKRSAESSVTRVPYLRVANVQRGYLDLSEVKEIDASEREVEMLQLRPGDILFNEGGDRDKLGRGWVWNGELPVCIHQNHVFRARLRHADHPKFISYYANSAGQRYFYDEGKHTTNLASINLTKLGALPLPLPSRDVQNAIVADLEKQLTRLDAAVAALRRVQGQLKRYRAAVLKAACEGRLVPTEADLAGKAHRAFVSGGALVEQLATSRRDRWGGRGRYQSPSPPPVSDLPALPAGWAWTTLDGCAEVKGGVTIDQKRKHTSPARLVPYLRVANVQRGYLDLGEVKQVEASETDIDLLALRPGDVLFNEGGDRDKLGRGWIWNGELPVCIHQNHVFRARLLSEDLNPKFVSWYANTTGQRFFFDEGKHTTNLASISMSKLKALPIPVPPPYEQHRIVAEVERRFSVISELEATVAANLQRAARLRQSILDRAFRGELVRDTTTA